MSVDNTFHWKDYLTKQASLSFLRNNQPMAGMFNQQVKSHTSKHSLSEGQGKLGLIRNDPDILLGRES